MYKKFFVGSLAVVFLCGGLDVQAQTPQTDSNTAARDAFRSVLNVGTLRSITVPTLIAAYDDTVLPQMQRQTVLVQNTTTDEVIPSRVVKESGSGAVTPFTMTDGDGTDVGARLSIPGGFMHYDVGDVDESGAPHELRFSLTFAQEADIDGIGFDLAPNAAMPLYVTVRDVDAGVVLIDTQVPTQMGQYGQVRFPVTTTRALEVIMLHTQPIRFTSLKPMEQVRNTDRYAVRFLGHPGNAYAIYADADRTVNVSFPFDAMPDLTARHNVYTLRVTDVQPNPLYAAADADDDGVADAQDNCPSIANPDQTDKDGNAVGDECDDHDRDGVINIYDNCPETPNRVQRDADGDGRGDACDGRASQLFQSVPWLPTVSIIGAAIVIGGILIHVLRSGSASVSHAATVRRIEDAAKHAHPAEHGSETTEEESAVDVAAFVSGESGSAKQAKEAERAKENTPADDIAGAKKDNENNDESDAAKDDKKDGEKTS